MTGISSLSKLKIRGILRLVLNDLLVIILKLTEEKQTFLYTTLENILSICGI